MSDCSKHMKLCFVGLKCFDLLVGNETPRYIGGIERQMVSLAIGLAKKGHKVTFLTYDHGQGHVQTSDGIDVVPTFGPDDGLPVIRFVFPRMTGIVRNAYRASSDLILQMGGSTETLASAVAALAGANNKRKFVFFAASDSDCLQETPLIKTRRERVAYKLGLRRSDSVVVQSERQKDLMKRSFDIESNIAVMPAGDLDLVESRVASGHEQKHVLWVGRISPEKRPELLIEVARACPQIQFDMVGDANESSEFNSDIKSSAETLSNLTIHGKVSDSKLKMLFQVSSILCCTSIIEGFPTTFLEAWSAGLPVVTTFDPDNVVSRHGLGIVAHDAEGLRSGILRITDSPNELRNTGRKCRDYFERIHSTESALSKIEEMLVACIDDTGTAPIKDAPA